MTDAGAQGVPTRLLNKKAKGLSTAQVKKALAKLELYDLVKCFKKGIAKMWVEAGLKVELLDDNTERPGMLQSLDQQIVQII